MSGSDGRAVLRAILVLPGAALVVVPAIILWGSGGTAYAGALAAPAGPAFWLAALFVAAGLALLARTVAMFARVGKGTLAPWAPTQRLVVAGVYRHVRNPMISGVFVALLGEALLAQSLPLLVWAAFFALANAIYMPLFEEPGLERRFGDDYRLYKNNVPRWLPRLTPWRGLEDG